MRELFMKHKENLRDLLRFGLLRTEELKNPGLYNGKLGMIILFMNTAVIARISCMSNSLTR